MASDDKIWLFAQYRGAFDGIPELKALVSTPFMVEIVMRILTDLVQLSDTEASRKQQLTIVLGDEAAQVTWAKLRSRGRQDKEQWSAQRVQSALEIGADAARARQVQLGIADLADAVVRCCASTRRRYQRCCYFQRSPCSGRAGKQIAAWQTRRLDRTVRMRRLGLTETAACW